MLWFEKILSRLKVPNREIFGCEEYEPGGASMLYMRRWLLRRKPEGVSVYLHVFFRSDGGREIHDHPWPFVSLILWRGYLEITQEYTEDGPPCYVRRPIRRKWPGMVLVRPARWRHRVELVGNKPAVTLVFAGKRCRDWGFYSAEGDFTQWEQYFREKGC